MRLCTIFLPRILLSRREGGIICNQDRPGPSPHAQFRVDLVRPQESVKMAEWGWGGGVRCLPVILWTENCGLLGDKILNTNTQQWAWGEKYLDCDKITQTLGSNNADNTSGKWIWSLKLFLCFPRIQESDSGFKKIQDDLNNVNDKLVSRKYDLGPLDLQKCFAFRLIEKYEFSCFALNLKALQKYLQLKNNLTPPGLWFQKKMRRTTTKEKKQSFVRGIKC